MKKLNRKGFTLIELLAVIVILAVVMVVTIPSVLSSMDKAKSGQLQNSADSVAEWFQKQYDNARLGSDLGGADKVYYDFLGKEKVSGVDTQISLSKYTSTSPKAITPPTDNSTYILKTAGLTNAKGVSGSVWVNGDTVCVELTADSTSSFYVQATVADTDVKKEDKNPNYRKNSGCK